MRVTNSMLVSNFMNNLNTNMTKLNKLQSQMSSGKKNAHISDKPVDVIYSREARYKLARVSHFRAAVDNAQDWLKQVESGLMELGSVIASAQEACVDASTDIKSDGDKKNVSDYIAQLRDHILTTLNTAYGDKYVYGGYNVTGNDPQGESKGPFTAGDDGSGNTILYYNGTQVTGNDPNAAPLSDLKDDILEFNVGPGINMPVNINGIDLITFTVKDENGDPVNKNLFNVLDDLYRDVNNGESAETISKNLKLLQDAHDNILAKTAEIGGRTNRLDLLTSRYEQDEINYMQMMSNAEDADMAEVLMNFNMAEAVYNAALAAGSKIIQTSLMDFLR